MAADSGGDPTENNSGGGDAVMTCPRPARALLPPTCVSGRTCFAARRRQRPPPSPVRSFVRSVPRIEIISLAFQRRGPLLISPLSPNTASASSGRKRGAEADGSVVADGDLRGAARLPRRRRRSGFARTRTAIFRRRGGGGVGRGGRCSGSRCWFKRPAPGRTSCTVARRRPRTPSTNHSCFANHRFVRAVVKQLWLVLGSEAAATTSPHLLVRRTTRRPAFPKLHQPWTSARSS